MPPKKKLGKRKKVMLSLNQKIEICNRLEKGVKRKVLMKLFNVASSTISGIKAQKEELLKFLSASESNKLGGRRNTLRKGKLEKLEDALFEWYSAYRCEGCKVSGSMIIEMAKCLYKQMKIKEPCAFSNGWLSRFKIRHGIRFAPVDCLVTLDSVKEPRFCTASQTYCEFFGTLVTEHDLSARQIYSACETKLLWRSLHDPDQVRERKPRNGDLMRNEECLTALVCANAAGTHKLKVFVVGDGEISSSRNNLSSVVYNRRGQGGMDKELYIKWFENIFVPAVKLNLKNTGQSEDTKVLLIFDNCAQKPFDCDLAHGNVLTTFLPEDVNPVILPMNQGIVHDLKCNYRIDVMKKLCRHEMSVQYFLSQYSIRDALFYLAGAWEAVNISVLKKAWEHLLPSSLIRESRGEGFEGHKGRQQNPEAEFEMENYTLSTSGEAIEIVRDELSGRNTSIVEPFTSVCEVQECDSNGHGNGYVNEQGNQRSQSAISSQDMLGAVVTVDDCSFNCDGLQCEVNRNEERFSATCSPMEVKKIM